MTEGGGGRRAAPTGAIPLLAAAILAIASLYFLVLSTRIVRARGPIEWVAPSTVVSNSHIAQRQAVPFLQFLWQIRRLLPPGASVAVIGPNTATGGDPIDDLVTIGQLPRCNVVGARAVVERRIPPSQFLAAYRSDLEDDRYRLVAVFEDGRLYERRP